MVGLNAVRTPFEFAPGIVLHAVVEPPTSTELFQAMQDYGNAGYVGHYAGNIRHEVAVDRAIHHESAALWVARFAVYALRVRTLRNFFAPVWADHSWSTIAAKKDRSVIAHVVAPAGRVWGFQPQRDAMDADLEWMATNYAKFERLWFGTKNAFRTAVEAFVDHPLQMSPRMATATLWAGIESLFEGKEELRFRLSARIAAYLEPAGMDRLALFKEVQKHYDVRSAAVHGGRVGPVDFLVQAGDAGVLLSRLLVKVIEEDKVPTTSDLERLLLT